MKIKFNQDAFIDDKVAFNKDSTHDLADASAQRWIRRGMAESVGASKIETVADAVSGKVKEVASNIVEKLDAVVNKEHEYESSEGASRQEEIVANNASEVENKKAKAHHAKNTKGL